MNQAGIKVQIRKIKERIKTLEEYLESLNNRLYETLNQLTGRNNYERYQQLLIRKERLQSLIYACELRISYKQEEIIEYQNIIG